MRKFQLPLLALVSAFLAQPSFAAIFDAADILPRNSGAVGAFGEVLLSDPTSEGIEAHGRYGLSDDWNVGAILGTGSKNKNFRLGAEGVYNLIPDWQGQLGVSFLGTATFLNRPSGGGLQLRVAPMIHKRITGFTGYPANIYLAIPWYIEARQGTYKSATQLVLGSDFDIADASRYYVSTEAGIRLSRADSYILVGLGIRLGDLKFEKRERGAMETVPTSAPARKRANAPKEKEYTDEDFKK